MFFTSSKSTRKHVAQQGVQADSPEKPGLRLNLDVGPIILTMAFPTQRLWLIGAVAALASTWAVVRLARPHDRPFGEPGSGGGIAATERMLHITVGEQRYVIPENYLGEVVRDLFHPPTILQIHLRYPDLFPVGNTSGLCERKVVLTDKTCPYFTAFIVSSEQLPGPYATTIPNATYVKSENGYMISESGGTESYLWTEDDGNHVAECIKPSSPPPTLQDPSGHTTCKTWGLTPKGGAYEIMFAYEWRLNARALDKETSKLVDQLVQNESVR